MNNPPGRPSCWTELKQLAQAEVQATLDSLPARLRDAAAAVPVSYERRPGRALIADGLDPDLLGLFVGGEFAEGDHVVLPAQVILFLDNLWDLAEADPEVFREEVRVTLLHELGHYLGLGEDDLEQRGLE